MRDRPLRFAGAAVALLAPLLLGTASAEASTTTVVTAGLNNPCGLGFGPDGQLYVAEGGVGRQKSESGSGGSLVDVVQAAKDRPGDHFPINSATTRHRSLQSERAMGSILVVIPHELSQHRSHLTLVEGQAVIQALLP